MAKKRKRISENNDTPIINDAYQSIEYLVDWENVHCYEGYCKYNPNKTILRVPIEPIKIANPLFTASMNDIIKQYHKQLPEIKWKIDRHFKLVFFDEKAFKDAIPNFVKKLDMYKSEKANRNIKRNNLIITINDTKYNYEQYKDFVEQKIIEQKSKQIDSDIFYGNHILDWKHIIFLDGCYVILPIIKGLFIEPIVINKKNCKKIFNDYIAKDKEHLHDILISINRDFKIEHFLTDTFDKLIFKLSKMDLEQLKAEENSNKKENNNSLFSKVFVLNWEDVQFSKGRYSFDPNYNKSLCKHAIERLYIKDARSKVSFNFIIKYLMKRMPIIHYQITENYNIKLLNTPLLEAAISFLVKEQNKYDIGIGEIADATGHTLNAEKLTFASAMSKAASMRPEDFKKYKSQFINYLILQQYKEYKVVPMSESITHSNVTFEEATFIFTIKSWDNNLLLIIENVNPDRSTILFKVHPNQYKDALQTIFDFMQSNLVNKRSSIREKSLTFSECGIMEYWTCNHDSFNDWRERMERYIEFNII